VLIALILLSSLLPIQYVGGFSIVDPMSDALAITTANAESALFITFGLGLTLGEFFLGPLADKYGRLPLAVVCLNCYAISSLICAIHYSPTWFLVFRMISGFAVAAGIIITRVIISDNLDIEQGASMLSRVKMYSAILIAIYPLAIEYAIHYFDLAWLTFFVLNAIFSSIVSMQALILLNKLHEKELNPDALAFNNLKEGFKHTLGTTQYRRPLWAFLMAAIISSIFSFTLPIITQMLHGAQTTMILTAGIGVGIGIFIVLFINRTLLDHGVHIPTICTGLLLGLAIVALAIAIVFQLPFPDATRYDIFLILYITAISLLAAFGANIFMVCSESFDKTKVHAGFITSLTLSLKGFMAFIASMILPLLEGQALSVIAATIVVSVLSCTTYYVIQYKK